MDHSVNEIIERELPAMPGWCTPEKGKRLAELAEGAHLCVELGVFGGRSLVAMALGLRTPWNTNALTCHVDGIDPYETSAALEGTNDPANDEWWSRLDYESIAKEAQKAICRLGLYRIARLIRMRSKEVVGFYADGSIDVLHQDSNHSEEISHEEVLLWAPKICSGGFWILDDADWETTKKAQRELEQLGFELLEDHKSWRVYGAP